jgi:lipopolysaccharide transport system permease protein
MHVNNDKPCVYEITSKKEKFSINLKEIYLFKDLLYLFVRRDIVSLYKQTILGPLWLIIQPVITTFTQFIVFGMIAKIPSDGIPYFLFVFSGNVLWSYFSSSFLTISETFKTNQGVFGKVYFPRAIMPLSITISSLLKFGVQFIMFLVIIMVYNIKGYSVNLNVFALFIPLVIIIMALISMGCGMLITSLTIKYRDFNFLLGFGITLVMYITPVVFPTSLFLSNISSEFQWLIYANPLTGLFDLFRFGFLGAGVLNWFGICWSFIFGILVYLLGLVVFNNSEKTFMDTI